MSVIKYVRKDNYPIQIQILDANGDPVSLSGATVYFAVKSNLDDPTYLFQVSVTSHTDPLNGETEIPITSSQSDLLGEYTYDVSYVIGGVKRSVINNKIVFINNVTAI